MKRTAIKATAFFLAFIIGGSAATLVRFRRAPAQLREIADPLADNHWQTAQAIMFSTTLQAPQAEVESLSPYAIKRFVDEHKDTYDLSLRHYWQALGVTPEDWEKYVICDAEIFELGTRDNLGKEVMLRLHDGHNRVTRFVIFKPVNSSNSHETKWVALGYFDYYGQKEYPPQHRVYVRGGKRWLVLRFIKDRGAGVAIFNDAWYEIKEDAVREVLNYPSRGSIGMFISQTYTTQQFETEVLNIWVKNRATLINVEFSVSYDSGERLLFEKKQKAVFIKRPSSKRFILDSASSGLAAKELDAIYRHESLGEEDLLKYNYGTLTKIATGRESARKEWLREFLEGCKNSAEKKALHRMLSQ